VSITSSIRPSVLTEYRLVRDADRHRAIGTTSRRAGKNLRGYLRLLYNQQVRTRYCIWVELQRVARRSRAGHSGERWTNGRTGARNDVTCDVITPPTRLDDCGIGAGGNATDESAASRTQRRRSTAAESEKEGSDENNSDWTRVGSGGRASK